MAGISAIAGDAGMVSGGAGAQVGPPSEQRLEVGLSAGVRAGVSEVGGGAGRAGDGIEA